MHAGDTSEPSWQSESNTSNIGKRKMGDGTQIITQFAACRQELCRLGTDVDSTVATPDPPALSS